MKVLFAVSNESISESIVKKYQKDYKEIISYKNVYYFNAILKEIQRDKSYDRIVISEDLEPFANNDYNAIDKFIFDKLDSISDEAIKSDGEDTPIILISSDRRAKSENMLVKLFGIGIYDALIGQDRSIEQVCKLIKKPRTKKEAKAYYKIESEDVNYKSENEDSVSEVEIQNILAHYKKLGKNEEEYVESFDNIASQYTDSQLKVISKFLPLNVKAVLEVNSPKYQSIMAFSGRTSVQNKKEPESTENGLKINFIENQNNKEKMTRPVVVPTAINTKANKRILDESNEQIDINDIQNQINIKESLISEINEVIPEEPVQETPKKGRGRPRKIVEDPAPDAPKRSRGRPRKVVQQEPEEADVNIFGLNDEDDSEEDNSTVLPGFDVTPNDEEKAIVNESNNFKVDIESLLTRDQKIVAFIGSSKNGTSFIINNLAQIFSGMGINTAILDMTKNKNSYFIYTKNEEELRKIAYDSIENLSNGKAEGIKVNNNLTVYTAMPTQNLNVNVNNMLATLVKNHSLILVDCDFTTPIECFSSAQEIYLIQSMDILTIQPLTEFLRELKTKGALLQEKLKIIINKETKVKGLSSKVLIGGMAFYNDPGMSFMTELFNKDEIKYKIIPFSEEVYSSYMEGIVNCKISTHGYPKNFVKALKDLGNMVYPLLNNKYKPVENYKSKEGFSNNTNDTLNKMKNNY